MMKLGKTWRLASSIDNGDVIYGNVTEKSSASYSLKGNLPKMIS